jgi:molecular chaperone HtpG
LYCDQVFITDEVKNILPDFLTLLHGVVDSPDIPLNVSRSYLQEDGNVKKISSHITRKVADKLLSMFNNDRPDFEKKWDDIGTFIHYGMLTDEKFYEKATSFALYKNTSDQYFTFEEFRNKISETQKDKSGNVIVLYASSAEDQHSYIGAAQERGYEVLVMNSPLTPHLISNLEQKNQGVQFKRVDAGIIDKLIEKEEQLQGILTEEQKNSLKPVVEELAGKDKFHVEFAAMSPQAAPILITQHEFIRRMKEQEALGGGNGFGFMPSTYNLVLNSASPQVESWATNPETSMEKIQHAIDLACLSQGLLKGEALSKFVRRGFELIS